LATPNVPGAVPVFAGTFVKINIKKGEKRDEDNCKYESKRQSRFIFGYLGTIGLS
jgi:hypothetical protein